ncbi:hypothetical protein NM208_g5814 [Fusarium decemcellulare]|uniref:Uncharacterized protein n=1 Tax=Fusarium decemcellulare TaxID=57161 RepID=A0ACC1SFK1_9HYPO|nr:hypothetical protein NM208_g5814 [Fusarium decemcellulare]
MRFHQIFIIFATSAVAADIKFLSDTSLYGPPLEVAHAFYNQYPTGIAVSRSGRKFTNYPGAVDPENVYNGKNSFFAVGELTSLTQEATFPNREINSPPGGAINYTTTPPTGANYPDRLIGVQSVVIDGLDRLWILDTGRVLTTEGLLVQSSYGGPKIVGVNLTTNEVFQTVLFPQHVAYPNSYIDDLRFDLRPELTESGKGVAYITDASSEGRSGIITVDLGTGESWRHLNHADAANSDNKMVPFVWGEPIYGSQGPLPFSYFAAGTNGITLSPDGETLYFGPFISRHLYSVPTANLRDRTPTGEIRAQSSILDLGQKGWSDGFESDTNGLVYMGNAEQNAVVAFNPKNGTVTTLVRDPRINAVDTLAVGEDGYLYFTVNQIHLAAAVMPGTDRRVKPWALFRVKLPNGGEKIKLL